MGKTVGDTVNNNATSSAPQSSQPPTSPDGAPTQSTLNATAGPSTIARAPSPDGSLPGAAPSLNVQPHPSLPYPQPEPPVQVFHGVPLDAPSDVPQPPPIPQPPAEVFYGVPLNSSSDKVPPSAEEIQPAVSTDPAHWKALQSDVENLANAWGRATGEAAYGKVPGNKALPNKLSGLGNRLGNFAKRAQGTSRQDQQERFNRDGAALIQQTLDVASQITTEAAKDPLAERARLLPLCGKVILRALAVAGTVLATPVAIAAAAAAGAVTGFPTIPIYILCFNKTDNPAEKLPKWLCIPGASNLYFAFALGAITALKMTQSIRSDVKSIRADIDARRSVRELEAIANHLQGEIRNEPTRVRITQEMADQEPRVVELQV